MMTEDKAINHNKIPLKIGNERKSGVFVEDVVYPAKSVEDVKPCNENQKVMP